LRSNETQNITAINSFDRKMDVPQMILYPGEIFNNASPYIVKTDNGDLYQVTWYSGYQGHAGDEVILTNDHGACSMVSKNGSAQVFVKGN
jgi:hypothetical protein